jgi:hypothetical protein
VEIFSRFTGPRRQRPDAQRPASFNDVTIAGDMKIWQSSINRSKEKKKWVANKPFWHVKQSRRTLIRLKLG